MLVACGLGVVLVGAWAARVSAAERPTGELLAAWGALGILAVGGAAAGEVLGRRGGAPRWALAFVIAVSGAAQWPLVVAPPALSDDVYRYAHDGRVARAGVNPYRHPPSSPALDAVAGPERSRVNHPDIRTLYPPVAQVAFAASAIMADGIRGLKITAALAGLLLAALTAALLPADRRLRAAGVAWHPLVLLEGAGAGHVDLLGAALLAAAVVALERGRRPARRVATVLLALAAGVKLLPGAVAVPLARRLGVPGAVVVLLATAACLVPLLATESDEGAAPGLAAYAEHWEFNGLVHPPVRAAVEALDVHGDLRSVVARVVPGSAEWLGPQHVSRGLLLAGFVGVLAWSFRRARAPGADLPGLLLLVLGGYVLLSPTVHPWYLAWVLPWVVLRASVAWAWLSVAVGVSYATALAAGGGPWVELGWPRLVEYAPFVLLWAAAAARRSRVARESPERPAMATSGDLPPERSTS